MPKVPKVWGLRVAKSKGQRVKGRVPKLLNDLNGPNDLNDPNEPVPKVPKMN